MPEDIEEKIINIISEQLGIKKETVTPEAKLVEELGADSLDTIELIMEFEDTFNIQIPDEDAEKITTVREATDYVGERYQGNNYTTKPASTAS